MTGKATVAAFAELQAELRPDEVLLWQARPTRLGLLPGAALLSLVGLLMVVPLLSGAWSIAEGATRVSYAQGVFIVAACLLFIVPGIAFMLALPMVVLMPTSAAYGLTDSRAIKISSTVFFRPRVLSVSTARIGGIERKEWWWGTGDITFFREQREGGEGAVYYVRDGFEALGDARTAELEILAVLAPLRAASSGSADFRRQT